MSGRSPYRGVVALFLLKFVAIAAALLVVWWIIQPGYIYLVGQSAGLVIRYLANIPIDGMEVNVDDTGVLNTKTSLAYLHEERRIEIEVAFLVANLPAYVALVLATGGLTVRKRLRALTIGTAILFAGHVAFLAIMFAFSREAQRSPELPTAFGMFVMTLPFLLWIVLAYWDRAAAWFDATPSTTTATPPDT